MAVWLVVAVILILGGTALVVLYRGLSTGAVTIDVGWGRRVRPLGPTTVRIGAPREAVFELLAQPYLGRATRAIQEKVQVLERGADMVLAAHRTQVNKRLTAVTVETVRLIRPERIDFRLVRGPVPHVVEYFQLDADGAGATRLEYRGELGTDGWAVGAWWGRSVAGAWERAVESSLAAVKAEAERRAAGPPQQR